MKLWLFMIVACAALAIAESGSLRVKPSRKGVESELKALEHVDKVLEKEIDVVDKMESNRKKDDSGEENDVPATEQKAGEIGMEDTGDDSNSSSCIEAAETEDDDEVTEPSASASSRLATKRCRRQRRRGRRGSTKRRDEDETRGRTPSASEAEDEGEDRKQRCRKRRCEKTKVQKRKVPLPNLHPRQRIWMRKNHRLGHPQAQALVRLGQAMSMMTTKDDEDDDASI